MAKKLTLSDVLHIRRLYEYDDITYQEIADQYGISENLVGKIVRGERWGERIREAEDAASSLSRARRSSNGS